MDTIGLATDMKIALITDTHWGARNDGLAFLYNYKQFFDNIFFPEILKRKINIVVHLGDIVERRKYINYYTLQRMKEDFITPCHQNNIALKLILGNHDIYYKDNFDVVGIREMDLIGVTRHAQEVTFLDNSKALFVPWINAENAERTYELIKTTDAKFLFGHLELYGFEMYKGIPQYHGEDPSIYKKFDKVLSGHYHHRSNSGNIFYLGSHAESSWADYNDDRGFHIFDTCSGELEFIQNPYRMFHKIIYDDQNKTLEEILRTISPTIQNTVVKVVVRSKLNPFWFDTFIDKVESLGVVNLQVVDDHLNMDFFNDDQLLDEAEDTVSSIRNVVAATNLHDSAKESLEHLMISLYNDALAVGEA
jgi:DNA repair exonuclease SbcCD nuclease subunit